MWVGNVCALQPFDHYRKCCRVAAFDDCLMLHCEHFSVLSLDVLVIIHSTLLCHGTLVGGLHQRCTSGLHQLSKPVFLTSSLKQWTKHCFTNTTTVDYTSGLSGEKNQKVWKTVLAF